MTKKLKLALVALLGFSAACSSVKNSPSKSGGAAEGVTVSPDGERPSIRVMYGVPAPREQLRRAESSQMDPVAERPETDSLSEAVGTARPAK